MSDAPALDKISAESFREQLNKPFSLKVQDGTVDLELREVRSLGGDTPREDKSPFSVLFRGPSDFVFEQQIVELENDGMGNLALFVVPLGPDLDDKEKRMLYEAVFT